MWDRQFVVDLAVRTAAVNGLCPFLVFLLRRSPANNLNKQKCPIHDNESVSLLFNTLTHYSLFVKPQNTFYYYQNKIGERTDKNRTRNLWIVEDTAKLAEREADTDDGTKLAGNTIFGVCFAMCRMNNGCSSSEWAYKISLSTKQDVGDKHWTAEGS